MSQAEVDEVYLCAAEGDPGSLHTLMERYFERCIVSRAIDGDVYSIDALADRYGVADAIYGHMKICDALVERYGCVLADVLMERYVERFVVPLAKDEDARAHNALANRYQEVVHGWLLNRVGRSKHMTKADDISQKAWEWLLAGKLREYDPDRGRFLPWLLYSVARNLEFRDNRAERRRAAGPLEFDAPAPVPREPDFDLAEKVRASIDYLEPEDRNLIIWFHFEGLSYKRIAELLSTTVPVVTGRLNRARQRLKDQLEQRLKEELE